MTKKPKQKITQSPYLDVLEAANYLGIARSTLDTYRSEGRGPAYRKHGWRVKYKRSDLDQWSERRVYLSTSAKA